MARAKETLSTASRGVSLCSCRLDAAWLPLPLLPPAPMPRRAAGGAGGGAGLAGVGGLEDFAAAARGRVVGGGFARAVGAEGQGFRAVHFVEMGFVDAGVPVGLHPTPRACGPRPSPSRGG